MTIKCGSCGIDIAHGSRFCSSCGWAVGADVLTTRTMAAVAPHSSAQSVDGSRFPPGALLAGRYRIVALLGRGGMGEVYRADDLTLGQQVALKFLPESVAGNPHAVARFRNEVRLARRVSHTNVCRVYDLGEVEGYLFLSMEYVDGENLDSLLRRIGRLPVDKAIEIARRLCAGLAAAHEKGILHRDLKPANVMLDGRGQAVLTDFGLAGVAEQIAGPDVRSGTPAYMAPEQLEGREVTVRSDIYSLGLVLYEIFTGRRPFESDTLAGMISARKESRPEPPSSVTRDLDPGIERVILRCLEAEPSARPASALAVAAALPGGDPLAAALAAGETPSPQMVAAAGEGLGLAPRVAIPVLVGVIAVLAVNAALTYRSTALAKIRPEYSAEVLSQKARDMIQRIGYTGAPADEAYEFSWATSFHKYVETNDKPFPEWNRVLSERAPLLQFWYRQSPYPLTAVEFHDDHLTPGLVTQDDPPFTRSGMIQVELDARGRLIYFEALPEQVQEPAKAASPVDWNLLFRAAELDPAQFQPAEPSWTFLATSDTRLAWTGNWPGTTRPLRVEAAALHGKPVVFALLGEWVKPWRMPPVEGSSGEAARNWALASLFLVPCIGGPLLARRNLLQGRGDRRGALRLAVFVFFVQMAMWLCRSHFPASIGLLGMFILAICTSVFYGVAGGVLYLALEPFVRRHWPQTLISWTSVLTGRLRDPIVGRDVLFGVAMGLSSWLIGGHGALGDLLALGSRLAPGFARTDLLLGVRSAAGSWLLHVPTSIRDALILVFLLLLLRALLRNHWLAVAALTLFISSLALNDAHPVMNVLEAVAIYTILTVTIVRLGLLAAAVAMVVGGLARDLPITANASAWYFANAAFMVASVLALAVWGFCTSIAGRRLWKQDLFG